MIDRAKLEELIGELANASFDCGDFNDEDYGSQTSIDEYRALRVVFDQAKQSLIDYIMENANE